MGVVGRLCWLGRLTYVCTTLTPASLKKAEMVRSIGGDHHGI